jgi:hypothetical protein
MSQAITLVNLSMPKATCTIYVGPKAIINGKTFQPTKWQNPHSGIGSRKEQIKLYIEYIKNTPDLKNSLSTQLPGSFIGCTCTGQFCEAKALRELAIEATLGLL